MHKTRSKPQPPPGCQPNEEPTSPDDSPIMEVQQMLGTLTTVLVTLTTKIEQLSQAKALQVDPI